MKVSTLVGSMASFAALVTAAPAPYSPFPLPDGFPTPSKSQLKAIQAAAGGSLPGGPLVTTISDAASITLQLLAVNENFEVAYFTKLLNNLKNSYNGYSFQSAYSRNFAVSAFTAIQKQEELHYLGVNAALAAAGRPTVAPCKYLIPDLTYLQSVALAETFTSVVIGVLPYAQTVFASDPATLPYVNLFGSVITQESEQNGWFRTSQGKLPSAAPFLTTEGPSFALSFLEGVVAPGCAALDRVKAVIPSFGKLNVLSKPSAHNSVQKFSVPGHVSSSSDSLVYISGQNLPVTVDIYDVSYHNGVSTFYAKFPFSSKGFAKGLSIAALVNAPPSTSFANPTAVAAKTINGPGVIIVD